jgi:hypothetical protein
MGVEYRGSWPLGSSRRCQGSGTGITGLCDGHTVTHSDVALGPSISALPIKPAHCEAELTRYSVVSPSNRERALVVDRRDTG